MAEQIMRKIFALFFMTNQAFLPITLSDHNLFLIELAYDSWGGNYFLIGACQISLIVVATTVLPVHTLAHKYLHFNVQVEVSRVAGF